mgnify:FL=1
MNDTLIENKKAKMNYEIIESFESGIELLGTEVKSLRNKQGSILGSYITIRGGEAFLMNSEIPPFQEKNTSGEYDPKRHRKLLLNKSQIHHLSGIEQKKGLTIVPILIYNKSGKIKVNIAIVKGKKRFDKREDIKKRDSDREIRRDLSL